MAYAKHKIPAIPCANREAMAVPSTPVWKIRINTKSNTIFSMLQVAKKIIGDDYVGIVPCTDAAWRYSYGSFPKEGVISFLSFNLEDVPKKNEHAVIRSTDWFPLKLQHLK